MEDEQSDEDFSEGNDITDGEDFSASEEDWKPEKGNSSSAFESDQDIDDTHIPLKKKRITRLTKTPISVRKLSSLSRRRSSLKNVSLQSKKVPQAPVTAGPSKMQKDAKSGWQTDDSESSGDDYLVNPNEIDFSSSFYDVGVQAEKVPEFDCNIGTCLSESEDEDLDQDEKCDNKLSVFNNMQEAAQKPANLDHLHDFAIKLELAKKKLSNFTSKEEDKEDDIQKLLALGGEGVSVEKTTNVDGEWEEVQDEKPNLDVLNDGIQITVQVEERRRAKDVDLEAMLKRKINRVIRENQIYLHKVSLLCHIAHGVYCNKALNNTSLMMAALKLLPNKTCYPNGKTSIKYFESMIKWYKTAISIKKDTMYSYFRPRPVLPISLALQLKYKAAICKKDFVLIFIILLRAMGMQCRMVCNLAPLPLKPKASDLCSLKVKKEEEKKSTKKKAETSSDKTKKATTGKKIDKDDDEDEVTSRFFAKKPTESEQRAETSSDKTKKSTKKATAAKKIDKDDNEDEVTSRFFAKKPAESEQKNQVKKAPSKSIKDKKVVDHEKSNDTTEEQVRSRYFAKRKLQSNSKDKQSDNKDVKAAKKQPSVAIEDVDVHDDRQNQASTSKVIVRSHFFTQLSSNIENAAPSNQTKDGDNDMKKGKMKKAILKNSKTIDNKKSETKNLRISPNFLQQKSNLAVDKKPITPRVTRSKRKILNEPSIPQLDGNDDIPPAKARTKRKAKDNPAKKKESAKTNDSDDDFVPVKPKKKRVNTKTKDKRVLSTDDDDESYNKNTNKNSMDIWIEVFCEEEEKWICIDLFSCKVHCVDVIRKAASKPLAYIFAWNNDNTIKDVSPRYCPQWHTATRKLRVEQEWFDDFMDMFKGKRTARDRREDRELYKLHLEQPLPKTISEYKNHPLYALQRHLLKFEAIYPPNAVTLGFVRGEPVYARECVHTLHSREIWLKQARVIKPGEEPYKIVKARPKWDKFNKVVIKDQPLHIFGYWQTEDYDPPTAENGIVPRNAYGNVELFKKRMLPKKTVHLRLPGLNRICRKLEVDCAPAVIGFDFHQGVCHPMFDGFVVCEEYAELVVQAYNKDIEDAEQKQKDKISERALTNWKKLIKGLYIKQKLANRYNFKEKSTKEKASKK